MSGLEKSMRRNGVIVMCIGVFFAFGVLPILHPVVHIFLKLTYWPLSEVPKEMSVPIGVLLAISGGLTAGVGATLWALGTYVAPLSKDAAQKVAITMAWSWFVTDSICSVLAGAPMNAALNLIFLLLLLQPGWGTRASTVNSAT